MGWLWIPVIFWFIGLIIFASPFVIRKIIRSKRKQLQEKSADVKPIDKSQGMFFTMEEEILEKFYHKNICFIISIIGVFIVTFGFIALAFVIT